LIKDKQLVQEVIDKGGHGGEALNARGKRGGTVRKEKHNRHKKSCTESKKRHMKPRGRPVRSCNIHEYNEGVEPHDRWREKKKNLGEGGSLILKKKTHDPLYQGRELYLPLLDHRGEKEGQVLKKGGKEGDNSIW